MHNSLHNANCIFRTLICVKLRKVLKMFGMSVLYQKCSATLPTQGRNRSELPFHMMDVSDFHEQATVSFLYYSSRILRGECS